jgi:hypothetical protein
MLSSSELAAISAADAQLQRALDAADQAVADAESATVLQFLSSDARAMTDSARANAESQRQWLAAWRAQRDAALTSPDDDPDVAAGLVSTATQHLKGAGYVVELGSALKNAIPDAVKKTATDAAQAGAAIGSNLATSAKLAAYVLPFALLFVGWMWLRPPRRS